MRVTLLDTGSGLRTTGRGLTRSRRTLSAETFIAHRVPRLEITPELRQLVIIAPLAQQLIGHVGERLATITAVTASRSPPQSTRRSPTVPTSARAYRWLCLVGQLRRRLDSCGASRPRTRHP